MLRPQIYRLAQQGLIKGPNLYVGATRLDYVIVILLMPEKEYKYTDVKKLHIFFIFYHYFCIVSKYALGTRIQKNIINVMLSTHSHGANATISSELHGASLCLANVVSGP